MTDKQIIIDGVDVSGCIVFNNKWGTPLCDPTEDIREAVHCSDNPNCLYKKYKRKEQECEELKNTVDYLRREFKKQKQINHAISKSCENLNCKDLQQLKAENEKLKEINSTLLEYRRHAVTCQDCYEDGLEDGKTSNKELRKLKQTLIEIKEICKTNVCKHCYSNFKVDDSYCKSRKDCDCYNILQKINEVEDEN